MSSTGSTRRTRPRLLRGLAVAVALLALGTACSGDGDDPEPPSPEVEERPPVVDYSGVALAGVPGTTTTTGLAATGTASIVGLVTGPSGPVVGATVRVEQLIARGDPVVRDVLTGPDGRYGLPGIPGGRYRVRAFLAPVLAVEEPVVRFLPDGQEAGIDLAVVDQRRVVARASVSPRVPYLDDPVNLAIVVATQAVDVDGVVRSTPLPGLQVQLDGLGAWALRRSDGGLRTPNQPRATTTSTTLPVSAQAFTDVSGVVRYELRCAAPGDPGLGLLVVVTVTPPAVEGQPPPLPEQRVDRVPLDLPDCVDPTTITTQSTTSTTARSGTEDD